MMAMTAAAAEPKDEDDDRREMGGSPARVAHRTRMHARGERDVAPHLASRHHVHGRARGQGELVGHQVASETSDRSQQLKQASEEERAARALRRPSTHRMRTQNTHAHTQTHIRAHAHTDAYTHTHTATASREDRACKRRPSTPAAVDGEVGDFGEETDEEREGDEESDEVDDVELLLVTRFNPGGDDVAWERVEGEDEADEAGDEDDGTRRKFGRAPPPRPGGFASDALPVPFLGDGAPKKAPRLVAPAPKLPPKPPD